MENNPNDFDNKKSQIADSYIKGIIIDAKTDEEKEELKTLLYGTANAMPEELLRVENLYGEERKWWGNAPAYENLEQIEKDIERGILEKVESDKNVKLITRFISGEFKEWPPYLHKETVIMLKNIGEKWRNKMEEIGLPDDIQLAITSLIRTKEYQEDLIKRGKLALKDSTHTKGQAFDIDGCGYYLNGKPINPRQDEEYKKEYNPKVHELLKEVLDEMKSQEVLNYILEFEGTTNQCFHIARNPQNRE